MLFVDKILLEYLDTVNTFKKLILSQILFVQLMCTYVG